MPTSLPAADLRCLECERALSPGEPRREVEEGVFCERCFRQIRDVIVRYVAAQSEGVDYGVAAAGALAGGALGAAVWWGFTVGTGVSFGLVALVIGYGVGHGVLRATGHKRSRNLQILSASVAGLAWVVASFLVTRTLILEHQADVAIPLVPDVGTFIAGVSAGFQPFDLIFLGIVLMQAWRLPAPMKLGGGG